MARGPAPRLTASTAVFHAPPYSSATQNVVGPSGPRIACMATREVIRKATFRTSLARAPSLRRYEALQLLVPMLHYDERGRRSVSVGLGRFDHQEAPTVRRHVVHA